MNQTIPSYYKCSLYDQQLDDYKNFSFDQKELHLEHFSNISKHPFKIKDVKYTCSFEEYKNTDWNLPLAIICIKDNTKLLKFTLDNLTTFNVFKYLNFVIVDDRSKEDIKSVCKKFPVSYMRVDNNKGFNFSNLNNIPAYIAWKKGTKEIVLWNSDLFVPDEKQIPELLELHRSAKSTISGTKLIYPEYSWDGNLGPSFNIKTSYKGKEDSYRGTIQFGGSLFTLNGMVKTYTPDHFCRFKPFDYYLANENRYEKFVTGAFQILDLEWYIETGGMNPSLSLNFQDVDFCLRAVSEDKKVCYFGEKNYLHHDESVTLSKSKKSDQFFSDMVLYAKIWNLKKFSTDIQKISIEEE